MIITVIEIIGNKIYEKKIFFLNSPFVWFHQIFIIKQAATTAKKYIFLRIISNINIYDESYLLKTLKKYIEKKKIT